MLDYAICFLGIAIVAGIFGFRGVAGVSAPSPGSCLAFS
ncbi:MAG: DUF1328 family protein [Anaerolineales bacterium]